jgi:hypothetical protein
LLSAFSLKPKSDRLLETAKELWTQSRTKLYQMATQAYQQQADTDPPQAAPSEDAAKLPNEPN